jgi:general secretion pathway protein I
MSAGSGPGSSPGQALARECSRGFTLIEALVALAIIAAVLSSIGAVIGTTVKGTKSIGQRLALTGATETVFAALPARNALKPSRQSGRCRPA